MGNCTSSSAALRRGSLNQQQETNNNNLSGDRNLQLEQDSTHDSNLTRRTLASRLRSIITQDRSETPPSPDIEQDHRSLNLRNPVSPIPVPERTSWAAQDPNGSQHFFFTYSASDSSSNSSAVGEVRFRSLRRARIPLRNRAQGSGRSLPEGDLLELYRELYIMEHLFASLFNGGLFQQAAENAAFQASWNMANQNPNSTGPPPASQKAIRQLPTIQVAAQDLMDESNRECCICFEDHEVGNKLTRLPCGHLFHGPCINQWLLKHCTCPVCRYELETDDKEYEIGRLERMKHRKPRYHWYELERMSIRELRDLMTGCRIAVAKGTATEKRDLVELIVKSGRVDIILTPAPSTKDIAHEPVHYQKSHLKQMGIGALRKLMADHGVYYNPSEVLEKEDMIQIFVNSGRLCLIPEDSPRSECSNGNVGLGDSLVEVSRSDVDVSLCEDILEDINMNECNTLHDNVQSNILQGDDIPSSETRSEQDDWEMVEDGQPVAEAIEQDDLYNNNTNEDQEIYDHNLYNHQEMQPSHESTMPVARASGSNTQTSSNLHNSSSYSNLAALPISQLKQIAYELHVNINDCLEKREMIERIATAASNRNRS